MVKANKEQLKEAEDATKKPTRQVGGKLVKEDDGCNDGKYSEAVLVFHKVIRDVAKSYTEDYAKSQGMTQTDK